MGPTEPSRETATPATPAKPEPMPKVSTSTVSVGMPRQSLIERFWVTARMRMPHTLLLRNHVTPTTATMVITMITRRGTGKVISMNSIPPRIHLGAVTSTLREVALAMRLICEARPPASSTPPRAETAQLPARTKRARGPERSEEGSSSGRPKPSTSARIRPAAWARATLRTNC